jgi:hydrogenase maturation factor
VVGTEAVGLDVVVKERQREGDWEVTWVVLQVGLAVEKLAEEKEAAAVQVAVQEGAAKGVVLVVHPAVA